MSSKPTKAFISYKSEGEEHNKWVEKFATDLYDNGIEPHLDIWEVRLGESFSDYMTSKISDADVFLFIITTKSVEAVEAPTGKGGAVKFEMQLATAKRVAGDRMRIIGIYREGKGPPAHLKDFKYADFRDDTKYEKNLELLVNDLNGISLKPPLKINESDKQDAIEIPLVEKTENRNVNPNISSPRDFVENVLKKNVDEKQKNTMLNSPEGVDRSIKEYQSLTECISEIADDANTKDSDVKFFHRQNKPLEYIVSVHEIKTGNSYDLSIAWLPVYGDTLKDSYLYIDIEKRLWFNRIHGPDSQHIYSEKFAFDLMLPDTHGWRRSHHDEQFFNTEELAYYCVGLLLERITE